MHIISIVLIIACVIGWIAIRLYMAKNNIEPLSRGQMRYVRRKARKQGVGLDKVQYRPRSRRR